MPLVAVLTTGERRGMHSSPVRVGKLRFLIRQGSMLAYHFST